MKNLFINRHCTSAFRFFSGFSFLKEPLRELLGRASKIRFFLSSSIAKTIRRSFVVNNRPNFKTCEEAHEKLIDNTELLESRTIIVFRDKAPYEAYDPTLGCTMNIQSLSFSELLPACTKLFVG